MPASGLWRWALAAGAFVALTAAGLLLTRHQPASASPPLIIATIGPVKARPTRSPTPHPLVVYVTGAVATPGVYTLRPGSRANDAVTAAGGAQSDADLQRINLAAPLTDGEQLTVPHLSDPTPVPTAPAKAGSKRGGPTPTPQGDWLLNVNTATSADFRAIPGIGKVTADRLVAYRQQNGNYGSVDDLLKAGLKKAELDRVRARLTAQ